LAIQERLTSTKTQRKTDVETNNVRRRKNPW